MDLENLDIASAHIPKDEYIPVLSASRCGHGCDFTEQFCLFNNQEIQNV